MVRRRSLADVSLRSNSVTREPICFVRTMPSTALILANRSWPIVNLPVLALRRIFLDVSFFMTESYHIQHLLAHVGTGGDPKLSPLWLDDQSTSGNTIKPI
jgi:hypothetical protein